MNPKQQGRDKMNNKLLSAIFGAVLLSVPIVGFANEQAQNEQGAEKVTAADRLAGKGMAAEDRQRLTERMNNITPEEQQRLNERFAAVAEASKAQAEQASEGAEEANPVCEVVLCLFGKMNGASQSECKSAEKKYFSILKKKRGKIRWSDTAKERLSFLNSCPSPENDKINDKFGKILG